MPLYTFIHNLLNVLEQIANKMRLQKKNRKRTHALASWILPLLGAPEEDFRWNLPEFDHRIPFHVLHDANRVPLRPIFRAGNSQT
jgi:hypothetical protein